MAVLYHKPPGFSMAGLTMEQNYDKFLVLKAVMKTCAARKTLREEPVGGKAPGHCQGDTTSELPGRNARTGAPVIAPMSDGCGRNQGGTVEYFVSHP